MSVSKKGSSKRRAFFVLNPCHAGSDFGLGQTRIKIFVQIRLFPSGNGRVFHLMANLVLEKLEGIKLYWGDTNLLNVSDIRSAYIAALRKAYSRDYSGLLEFAQGR